MIVLYLKHNNQFLQTIKGFPEVKEEGNKLLFAGGKVIINDLTKAGYKEYPDQEIDIPTEWDEELEMEVEMLVTLEELNLRDFTEEERQALFADPLRAKAIVGGNPHSIPATEMWELLNIITKKIFS